MAGSTKDDGTPRKNAARECVDCKALPPREGPSPLGQGRQYPTTHRPAKPRPIKSGATPRSFRCGEHTDARAEPRPECAPCAELPVGPGGLRAGFRPDPPLPIVSGKTKPSRRCSIHQRATKKAAKVKQQAYRLSVRHDITEEEYWKLYEAQGRKCAFPRCRATGKVKRLAVDHDRDMAVNVCGHERERSCRRCRRGLLCGPHNFDLMGKFAGDLEDALAYRDNPPARRVLGNDSAA